MKKLLTILLLPTLILFGCSQSAAHEVTSLTNEQANFTQLAISAASKISEKKFDELYEMFDAQQKELLSITELEKAWAALLVQMGDYQYYSTDFSLSEVNGTTIADIPFVFQNDSIIIEVSFNSKGQINGLYFLEAPDNNSKISLRLPNDHEVTFGSEPYIIEGSLTLPETKAPYPAVILLHDYGPSDRNGQVGPNLPFFDIAQQLSEKGIAVLRYDKRSYTYSQQLAQKDDLTVYDEIIDDAVSAFRYLENQPNINSGQITIAAFGISGLFIPRIDAAIPEANSYIMLNTTSRSISETILAEMRYTLSLESDVEIANKDALLEHVEQAHKAIQDITAESMLSATDLLGAPSSYWLDIKDYDPLLSMQLVKKPLLIIQSGRDFEVTAEDFQTWQTALEGQHNVQYQLYGNLNHLLAEGVGKSKPTEYQTKNVVSQKVTDDIAAFVKE